MTSMDTAPAPDRSRPLVSVCIANYNGMEVIDQLAALAVKASGHAACVIHRPGRPGDIGKVVRSVNKLHALGWTPATSLEAGLSQTWASLQETRA